MDTNEAIRTLIDFASRFGENAEEGFDRRVKAEDDDDACKALAESSLVEADDVIEIRNLWRAVKVAQEMLEQKA